MVAMVRLEDEIERKKKDIKDENESREVKEPDTIESPLEHMNLKTSIIKEDVKIISGVGPSIAEKLRNSGFDTVKKVAYATGAQSGNTPV